jgi:Concanavalin A-like lectin/glucanases superfamily/Secretion system C-terminal sorting domain
MKIEKYILIIFTFLAVVAQSQTPAGKSFYVDYNAWNDGTKPSIYIDCGNNNSFNTGYELTMECWVRAYNFGWNRKILGKVSEGLDNGYVLGFEAGHVYTEIFNPLANEVPRTGDGPLPVDSAWIHIASTFQAGGKLTNYINGIEVGSVDVPSNIIGENETPFVIGLAPWDFYSYEYFGDIDEVRIWNTTRTEDELQAFMHKSIDIETPGLVAYYNFNDSEGTSTTDNSEKGNNGTVMNADNNYWTWADSYAPFGDEIMQTMNDIIAAWYGKAADQYNYALTESGLSMVANIEEKEFKKFVVFGHNGIAGTSSDNKPENATADFVRLNREWYVNIGETITSQLLFNLDQASDGLTLPSGEPDSLYVLLYRENLTDDFQVLYSANDEVSNNLIFDDIPLTKGYYTVGYDISKLSGNTAINDINLSEILIYPNPAQNVLNIRNAQNCNLAIFDITGKEIYNRNSLLLEESFYLNINRGMYFVKISNQKSSITKKIIIQ